jgi:ATP synthase protein I
MTGGESGSRAPLPEREVGAIVGRKAERRRRARQIGRRGVWFGLGMFGLVGWAVALPTVAGVAIGLWLDARFPSHVSWTLTLLLLGALLGSLNAWYWVKRESRDE